MSWGWRKWFKLGPLTLNLSRRGQCGRQAWPILHEQTYPPATGIVAVWRLVAFPITVTADKKPAAVVMACLQLETSPELFDAEEAVYVRPAKREEPRWIIFTEARLG